MIMIKMKINWTKIGNIAFGTLVTFGLVTAIAGYIVLPKKTFREPQSKDFQDGIALIAASSIALDYDQRAILEIIDEDLDGNVDLIKGYYGPLSCRDDTPLWIVEGHKSDVYISKEGRTKIMTSEIQEAANAVILADKNLDYLLAEVNYERLQKE